MVKITKDDIGCKVLLRNGDIETIESVGSHGEYGHRYPVKLSTGIYVTLEGCQIVGDLINFSDVVKVLREDIGIKDKQGKLDLSLVPPEVVAIVAKVFEFGLQKGYSKNSWRTVENIENNITAIKRHLYEYETGNHKDHESKLPASWHLLCDAAMLAVNDMDKYQHTIEVYND